MAKKRSMTSAHASKVKREGHKREHDFADLIGGKVNEGKQTDKKDVLDQQLSFHSVKGGTWWQIFLYGRNRFVDNTMFKNIGNISDLMIQCIDAFPDTRDQYEQNKEASKINLQPPMRALAENLNEPKVKEAFYDKSLFDGGQVDFLTIQPKGKSDFHIFHKVEVVDCLTENLTITNSKARNEKQHDAQKVIFRLDKNVGEIEIRTDSALHYRQAKCRFNSALIFELLRSKINPEQKKADRVTAYGKAIRWFKIPEVKKKYHKTIIHSELKLAAEQTQKYPPVENVSNTTSTKEEKRTGRKSPKRKK